MPAAPKILAVASATDLDFRYGCTPAWWQLWKGLYEVGVDLIVTPYRGRAVESPWWRTAPNPLYREAERYVKARSVAARLRGDRYLRRPEVDPGDTDRFARELIWRVATPRMERHLEAVLRRERGVEAVVVFGVPMSHLRGVPTKLRERFGVPVIYYDGDIPMSLPEFGGMDTGFNPYYGADPSEYDLIVCNAEGGPDRARASDRRRAVQRVRASDLRRTDQHQHDAPSARDGVRLVDVSPVRARGLRRDDHLQSARRDRALVRAGPRAAGRRERGGGRSG